LTFRSIAFLPALTARLPVSFLNLQRVEKFDGLLTHESAGIEPTNIRFFFSKTPQLFCLMGNHRALENKVMHL